MAFDVIPARVLVTPRDRRGVSAARSLEERLGAVYTLALAVASVWAALTGTPGAAAQVPLWRVFSIGGLTASVFLLVNLRPASNSA